MLRVRTRRMVGMWRRNGEALEHESEFYRMNYWQLGEGELGHQSISLLLSMAGSRIRPFCVRTRTKPFPI